MSLLFRAETSNLYAWGAAGVSCFNFSCWGFDPRYAERMAQTFELIRSPKELLRGVRHYHYVPIWKDHGGTCPTGKHRAQSLQFRIDELGQRLTFIFRMADGRAGEKLRGTLLVRINNGTVYDVYELDINGKAIGTGKVTVADRGLIEAHGFGSYPPGIDLRVRLEDCPPFAGDNVLGIRWKDKTPELVVTPVMEVLEIMVEP